MTLLSTLQAFVDVAAFRLLPVLGYALVARSSRPATRALAALLLGALIALASAHGVTRERLAFAALALAWIALSAPAVHGLAAALQRGTITRSGLAVTFLFAYLVLPGIALPSRLAVYFLVLGWEAALSAYSYAVDARSSGSVRECCFFMVVNPLLVYTPAPELAAGPVIVKPRALARALAGALVMAFAIPLAAPRALPFAGELGQLAGYGAFIANGALVFVARYAALSGLASLQIGALGLLGFRLPERYHYPFLAKDPTDFWRRWNSYVGDWLRRYVFVPLSRALARAERRRLRTLARPIAIAVTMLAIGAYHDLYVYSSELRVRTSGTAAFAFAALFMTAWAVVTRATRRLSVRRPIGALARRPAVRLTLARVAMLHGAFAAFWFFSRP